jgi:hypothetical protein
VRKLTLVHKGDVSVELRLAERLLWALVAGEENDVFVVYLWE